MLKRQGTATARHTRLPKDPARTPSTSGNTTPPLSHVSLQYAGSTFYVLMAHPQLRRSLITSFNPLFLGNRDSLGSAPAVGHPSSDLPDPHSHRIFGRLQLHCQPGRRTFSYATFLTFRSSRECTPLHTHPSQYYPHPRSDRIGLDHCSSIPTCLPAPPLSANMCLHRPRKMTASSEQCL